MNGCDFHLAGATLTVLPSGALWWRQRRLLCVSDLHLGKSERMARRGGALLPPYETVDTLSRLEADLAATGPAIVVCLGDSFDDLDAARALAAPLQDRLATLSAGRRWIWIEGNHDAGPVDLPGTHLKTLREGALTFRHICQQGARGEVSGHYHPKARLVARGRGMSRPCVLTDGVRAILPAYGTYTGGLSAEAAELSALMGPGARAILIGDPPITMPMPRGRPLDAAGA
ncbi:MAG: ligase-associated DNA damage response endonuclease PdeM [Pseudomonadota bacterium]